MAYQGLQGGGGGISLSGNNTTIKPTIPTSTLQVSPNTLQTTNSGSGMNQGYGGDYLGAQTAAVAPVKSPAQIAAERAAAQAEAEKQAYINQLQTQLGTLDTQERVGMGNIENSYNKTRGRYNQDVAAANRNYDTTVQQNTQGYSNTRNGIYTNTRNTANALQRLLGMNGSGNSSAAYEQAPMLAATQGSQQLQDAQQTYSNNTTGLNNSWEDTQRQYKNAFEDLDQQKYSQSNGLKSSIAQTRAEILNKIQTAGGGNRTGEINNLLSQIANLGNQYANPVMRTADIAFRAPQDLGDYSLGQQSVSQNPGGATSDVAPSFLSLLTGQRDEYGNLIG